MSTNQTFNFIRDVRFESFPTEAVRHAKRCLLDLIGVGIVGAHTQLANIARLHAVTHYGAGAVAARLLFDGRPVSPVGAAFAGAGTIDSFDAHDGHSLTKGHIGVAVFPALAAYVDCAENPTTGRELLTAFIVGYEIGTRAGIALHRTSREYHTSGAWNALACAAVGARLLHLSDEETAHAVGIAEYYGPRSPMMRDIDNPTMVKDGSMWGAAAGVSATYLAKSGFTGAPAETISRPDVSDLWEDIGTRWRILEQYLKPQAICRWAQPAAQAILNLIDTHHVDGSSVEHVEIRTFEAATRLATRCPTTTEQAQYSLPYPVAIAIANGEITTEDLLNPTTRSTLITRLSESMIIESDTLLSERFPAERLASVSLQLYSGETLRSELTEARGGPNNPLTDGEVESKFRTLVRPYMTTTDSNRLIDTVENIDQQPTSDQLLDLTTGVYPNHADS